MPGGDRTGPWGAGATSGRGAGYCTGNNVPGYANPGGIGFGRRGGFGYGRGFGGGFGGGFGRGRRNRFWNRGFGWRGAGAGYYQEYPDYEPGVGYENERDFLKAEARNLRAALDEINKRLDKLQASKKDE